MLPFPRSLFSNRGIYNDIDVMTTKEIEELVNRGLNGDQQALSLLYNAYSHKMEKVCVKVVGDHMIAQELVHDAFILAFSKLNQLQNPRRFEQWLTSITSNVAFRYVNRNNAPQSISIAELSDEELYRKSELSSGNVSDNLPPFEVIMAAIDSLPEGYSKVFKMSVIQGMSHAEIADILGIAAHSSSSQLARAKKMLRKSLSTYWALLLALLLIPITYLFLRNDNEKQPTLATNKEEQDANSSTKKSTKPTTPVDTSKSIDHTPIPSTPHYQPKQIYTKEYLANNAITANDSATMAGDENNTIIDSIDSINATTNDSIPTQTQPTNINPSRDLFFADNDDDDFEFIPIKAKSNNSKWNLHFAYSGNYGENNNLYSPSQLPVTPPPHAGWPPIDGDGDNSEMTNNWYDFLYNLYMWREEYEWEPGFYETYGPNWTIDELNSLIKIAEANIEAGNEEITRESHHDLPFTFSLALQHRLTKRWSIESGLSYTLLSSQFTTGEPFAGIIDSQEIHYLGIPVKASYNWLDSRQWSLYTSLGFTMDIPVSSSVSSDFVLNGSVLLHQKESLNVPLQWSTGIGIGFQYNITPYFGIFAEPSFQYYIPDGSNIKTYRTEHPYNFTLPIGFRFSW